MDTGHQCGSAGRHASDWLWERKGVNFRLHYETIKEKKRKEKGHMTGFWLWD